MVELPFLTYSFLLCPWIVSQGAVKEMALRQLSVHVLTPVVEGPVNTASGLCNVDEVSLMSLFNNLLTEELLVLTEHH